MKSFLFKFSPLFLLIIAVISPSAAGQGSVTSAAASNAATPSTLDWETLRPDGEGFTVLMPKGSTFESKKEPYHKMELSMRVYLSNTPTGPVFAVVSMAGIKSNPALYSEMQRVNSYVDAFKNLFPPKIRKGAIAKLTLVGEKTLQGNSGREYRMTVGDLSGSAQAYATRKRFYAIVYLNSKKDNSIQDQFLSSFVLPERFSDVPTAVATQTTEAPPGNVPPVIKPNSGEAPDLEAVPNPSADAKTDGTDPRPPQPMKREPISGGMLNGKAIGLPIPDYPPEAKAAGASGSVVVQVTVDEQGNVISAHAVSGSPLLQKAAVTAALRAKFSPTILMGEPVKVTGILIFNFGPPSN
jgi:TonB family protein